MIGRYKRSNGLEGCLGKVKTGKIDFGTVASKRLAYSTSIVPNPKIRTGT